MGSYELRGPFHESLSNASFEDVVSWAVKLKPERNSPHPLNPVGQLRRVLSGHAVAHDAVLLLGLQFFEIFTLVRQPADSPEDGGGSGKAGRGALGSRIRSLAHGHLPLRRARGGGEGAEGRASLELEASQWQAEVGESEVLKDHVFSCGVAYAQVLKVRSRGASVTVYYHPNSMKAARLSARNHVASAMRFTFCTDSEEETAALLKELERRMGRYSRAALMLGDGWVLPSAMHIVAVTRPLAEGSDEELLLLKDPPWGSGVTAPASWGLEELESDMPLWVYLMTPLGFGKCEVSPQVLSLFRQGRRASFFVGVRHPQLGGSLLQTASRAAAQLRHAASSASEEGLEEASEDEWQPEQEVEESAGSAASLAGTHRGPGQSGRPAGGSLPRTSLGSSLPRSSSAAAAASAPSASSSGGGGGRAAGAGGRSGGTSAHGANGRHVRVHCCAAFVGPEAAAAEAAAHPPAAWEGAAPGLAHTSPAATALVLAVATAVASRLLAWGLLLTLLNACLAALHLLRPRLQPAAAEQPSGAAASAGAGAGRGRWHIRFVRAEVVADEPWSAAGSSVLAEAARDSSDGDSDRPSQVFASEFGFSEDAAARFLLACNQDEALAAARMRASHEWRLAHDCLDILSQPQPHFAFFKRMFAHGLLGVTKAGHPAWFMRIGDMRQGFRQLRDSGLPRRDLARHIALCLDYNFRVVESAPLPNGRALWVLDLKGMGFTDISGDAFELGKEIAGMISAHWPERLHRAFLLHPPSYFSVLWKLVEPLMAASTRRKIRLLRGKADMLRELSEEMHAADIPVEYGGQLQGGVYASGTEQQLWQLVARLNDGEAAAEGGGGGGGGSSPPAAAA